MIKPPTPADIRVPMISQWATAPGLLPFRKGAVRFAFGAPEASTSNAWRMWVSPAGDVYLACKDNMRETKVSLHASGRWRMAFTSEAIAKWPDLLQDGQDRAWEVWDEPPKSLPNTIAAFRLLFPTSELGVQPEQRVPKDWAKVVFIEPAPPGKLAAVTLFITDGDFAIHHDSEPSFRLACIAMSNGRWAQLVAHYDPENDIHAVIDKGFESVHANAAAEPVPRPPGAYVYFFGRNVDGARFIVGAHYRPLVRPD